MTDAQPTLPQIRDYVLTEFQVHINDFLSGRRNPAFAEAKGVVVYLAKRLTHHSYPEIAPICGYKEHSAAMHVGRRAAMRMETETEFFVRVTRLEIELARMARRNILDVNNAFEFTEIETNEIMSVVADTMRDVVARTVKREVDSATAKLAAVAPVIIEQKWSLPNSVFATAVADVVSAMTVLDQEKFAEGQPAARRKLDAALNILRAEFVKTNHAIERIAS